MTLNELRQRMNYDRDNTGDLRVVVETQNGGCPTRHMVDVKHAGRGFDWTSGLFLLHLAEQVVVVRGIENGCSLRQLAERRLADIKAAHEKIGFKYIMKAREAEWLDGFIEGVRMHITSCAPGDATEKPRQ